MASSRELTAFRCTVGVCSAGGEPPKGRRSSSAGFSRAAALLATAESGWTEANNKHLFFLLCCKYFTNRAALPARKPILCRGSCLLLRPGVGGTKLAQLQCLPSLFAQLDKSPQHREHCMSPSGCFLCSLLWDLHQAGVVQGVMSPPELVSAQEPWAALMAAL